MSFPADLRRTTVEDVQILAPGQEVSLPMEIVLSGSVGKSFRLDIRTDKGTYTGALVPEAYELLSPLAMSAAEFDAYRRRFCGLNETTKSFARALLGLASAAGVSAEEELLARVRRLLNVYCVQGAGEGELMFAASCRKSIMEEKVLVTVLSARCVMLLCLPPLRFSSSLTPSLYIPPPPITIAAMK